MPTEQSDSALPKNPSRSWTRLDGVDILRALAIFLVLMNHTSIRLLIAKVAFLKYIPHPLINPLVWNGQRGVHVFFAVSGFLITSTTIRRWGSLSRISMRDFYLLRFARIVPLLLTLLAVLSIFHLVGVHDFVVTAKTGGLGRALLAALTFHVNVLEARRGYLPGNWDILWSLSVEEMFYIFFPLVCRVFGKGRFLIVLLFTFVVLGPFGRTLFAHGSEIWGDYSYLSGMDAIALGCITALLVSRRNFSRSALRIIGGIGIAVLLFNLGFPARAYRWEFGRWGLDASVLGLGACLVIIAAAQTKWRSPRIVRPFLVLGHRSYEIYLTHMFVVFALFHLFVRAGMAMRLIPELYVTTILLTVILGELVARFYSEPMNRWLRKRWGDGPEKLGSMVESK